VTANNRRLKPPIAKLALISRARAVDLAHRFRESSITWPLVVPLASLRNAQLSRPISRYAAVNPEGKHDSASECKVSMRGAGSCKKAGSMSGRRYYRSKIGLDIGCSGGIRAMIRRCPSIPANFYGRLNNRASDGNHGRPVD